MTPQPWRVRLARWLAPAEMSREPEVTAPAPQPVATVPDAWGEVSEQFAWRLLVLTEQLRTALDDLEASEEDPDRLAQLYLVDHGVTRMRRVARDLRVLGGRASEEIAGHTTSLLDIIRMAASSIEHYSRVSIGPVAELAVVAYAADDVASLLAALTDNATRYSPSTVTVSAHLLADGGVMLRVEDTGLGIESGWLTGLNNVLAGPLPDPGIFNFTGRHTGFAVVHRLARRHGLRVQLARREPPAGGAPGSASGTIAMVVVPASLLCEIPGQPLAPAAERRPPAVERRALAAQPARPRPSRPPVLPATAAVTVPPQDRPAREGASVLPRREPGSVRTPARRTEPAAEQQDTPDPAADGLAFAADLQAFSAALENGRPDWADAAEKRPGDTEGTMP